MSVLAGFSGIYIGGYYYPIYISHGFFSEVVNSEKNYFNSPEFGNWAMWFGALSTFAAAVGTMGSFAFLAYDHVKNRAFNQRLKLKEMEILQFQQYQAHKDLFTELLSDLQSHSAAQFNFRDINTVYKKIFPKNRIGNCVYHMEFNDSEFVKESVELLNLLIVDLNDVDNTDLNGFFSKLENLIGICNLDFKGYGLGDMKYNDKYMINIYHLTDVLNQLRKIIVSIVDFIGIPNTVVPLPLNRNLFESQMLSFMSGLSNVRKLSSSDNIDLHYLSLLSLSVYQVREFEKRALEPLNRYCDDILDILKKKTSLDAHLKQNYMRDIYFDAIAHDFYDLSKKCPELKLLKKINHELTLVSEKYEYPFNEDHFT